MISGLSKIINKYVLNLERKRMRILSKIFVQIKL